MEQKEFSKLTDEELLEQAKKSKSSAITHAVLIGFLIGIIIFSVAKNALGFFTLIPLFLIYTLTKNSGADKALKEELKARNLK